MKNSNDQFNLEFTESAAKVDSINKKFYGRFNYPWPPRTFPAYPKQGTIEFLNQDVGSFTHDRIPKNPKIWVAGCGTNQAIFTALKYPQATIVGTDISTQSLQLCRRNADSMGIENLTLQEMSLNEVAYDEEFDYIICTGVIHHNSNPERTLKNIVKGLKKEGVLELMVYNYYHRLLTTASQKVVREFYDPKGDIDMDFELEVIRQLIDEFDHGDLMRDFLQHYKEAPKAKMADALLQPVEYSYTVATLGEMLSNCNLEYMLHTINQFDINKKTLHWNLPFDPSGLGAKYDHLEDAKRWQITNLLLLNNSPMLWHYIQRKDATASVNEKEVCEAFLNTKFEKHNFSMKNYVINIKGTYTEDPNKWNLPNVSGPSDALAKQVWEKATPDTTIRDILKALGQELTFYQVNDLRIKLTTLMFPYLIAVQ
jgi:SAM-dependent methyltransferase